MINRKISSEALQLFSEFPILAILGPRQSGKTTLSRMLFPDFEYISFEDPDMREYANADPRGFLQRYPQKVILDEIQRVPDLISYLQTHVDKLNTNSLFIITGSHNLLLMEQISQSLAGRIGISRLLPFSLQELNDFHNKTLESWMYTGFYPRIYDKNIRPSVFYKNYIATYIEKDISLLKNIQNRDTFIRFMKIIAGRTGQILNTNTISEDCGISHNTVKEWLSILETSYIIYKLRPFHKNYNKRLIKNPKIYFTDTGLACHLLGIRDEADLEFHYLRGSLFENFIISEFLKENFNQGEIFEMYYWRDNHQKEIDLIIEDGQKVSALEIKSGKTIQKDFFSGLKYWAMLSHNSLSTTALIYGGDDSQTRNDIYVLPWSEIPEYINTKWNRS